MIIGFWIAVNVCMVSVISLFLYNFCSALYIHLRYGAFNREGKHINPIPNYIITVLLYVSTFFMLFCGYFGDML